MFAFVRTRHGIWLAQSFSIATASLCLENYGNDIGLINVTRLVRTVDVTSVDFTNKDVRNAFSNAEKSDDKSKINTCVGSHSFHKIKFKCAFKQMTILENYVYLTSKNYPIMLGHSKLILRQNYCLIFV